MLRLLLIAQIVCGLLFGCGSPAMAEDGYDLWLRYPAVEAAELQQYRKRASSVVQQSSNPTLAAAETELRRGLKAMLGNSLAADIRNGAIVIGTAYSSPVIAGLHLPLSNLGPEGYLIRSARIGSANITVIAANSEKGVLYGSFALLRRVQTRQPLALLNIADAPRFKLRMLNHWDNLDRSVERGYAGQSLWDWDTLPLIQQRYMDYARANASIGINGTVLTNVNANAQVLTAPYLSKVKALADAFRPYGIRVYLTARFSAPQEIGGLETSDPLDPVVRRWWKLKTAEIYSVIPDFGGFLVKANSEGQPGPQNYKRTHADGANMMADALAPHGGVLLWRAFVYSLGRDQDRVRAAYDEFVPFDGKFRSNVILQVKNGPLDFQPREPFSPIFGAMPETRLALEAQITKEYLGYSTHLAYLGTMWSEVLRSRTARPRLASTVADSISAIAGVANTGTDRNWSGSDFDQANWYAFGRLAWDPQADPQRMAEEWARMTWGNDPRLHPAIVAMMMNSRQAVVDYMTPLGLAHLMGTDHHHGPAPWVSDLPTPSWNPAYFHRADRNGIGFDRTRTGSNAVAQYAPQVAREFAGLDTVPEDYLLWFHHLPWTHRMRSGATLWEDMIRRYDGGVEQVARMQVQWASLKPLVDADRYVAVSARLAKQHEEAIWWRDASIAYWQSINQLPLPAGTRRPAHPFSYYQAIRFEKLPGQP
ncbi:MAG TPA: alpha-glucuronidase family glycosyl hydrolase [Sphingomicrobium sp.]